MGLAPFDLNLRHMRAVAAIEASGSMSAAAEAVSLSQPALTQGLAKLERQLGCQLFDRRPDGMTPTREGAELARRARAAFEHLASGARGFSRGFARSERLMTMTQLRAFLALTDAGSFAAGAAATGLSQPALHRAVRDLEQVVGGVLVERRGRGVALSAAGRRLARGARMAAGEIAAGIAEIAVDPGESTRKIVVGAMPLSRAMLVPRAVALLVAENPQAVFDIVEGSWRELVEPLRDGAIDLMVGALRPEAVADLDQVRLHDDRLIVVAGAAHPLARAGTPSLDALAGFPWIVGRVGSPLRAHWEMLFAGRRLPMRPVECGSVMAIRGLLTGGQFLTLLSPDQVALEVRSFVLCQVGPPLEKSVRAIGVTTRRGWRPTATQRRFVALLAEVAEQIDIPEIQ